jgi:hypothetical protein
MNMPGFAADASLEENRMSMPYHLTSNPAVAHGGGVMPQFGHWSYCDESGCYVCSDWGCRRIGPPIWE